MVFSVACGHKVPHSNQALLIGGYALHCELASCGATRVIYLCLRDDIPENGAKGFVINEQSIFAVRRFGELFVYHNRCPHLGIELEWLTDQFLDSEGELIQCATHGALFTIDTGLCVAGPCTGDALDAVGFIEQQGAIYLTKVSA